MAKLTRPKSRYATKQGRARKAAGDDHDGPRTRYAAASPLSADHVTDPGHRLSLYFDRGLRLEREARQRRAAFEGYDPRGARGYRVHFGEVYIGGKRSPGLARVRP